MAGWGPRGPQGEAACPWALKRCDERGARYLAIMLRTGPPCEAMRFDPSKLDGARVGVCGRSDCQPFHGTVRHRRKVYLN